MKKHFGLFIFFSLFFGLVLVFCANSANAQSKKFFVRDASGWRVSTSTEGALEIVPDGVAHIHQNCSSWFIENTRQLGGVAGVDINAIPAWSKIKDSGFMVGWLDSGIDEQKFPNMVFGEERIYAGEPPRKGDVLGHGTTTLDVFDRVLNHASLRVRSYRIFDEFGDGNWTSIFSALNDAIADGCQIINMSGGGNINNQAPITSIIAAHPEVIFVFSAGNRSTSIPEFPAVLSVMYLNVISVAALDRSGHLTSFSAQWATLAAPGETIFVRCEGCLVTPMYICDNSGVKFMDGTSFSAPMVTAALVAYMNNGGLEPKVYLVETLTHGSFTGLQNNGYLNFAKLLEGRD